MTFEHARAVADAILYEGYVLYPYRASSKKNQWRWQFGLLAPRAWSEAGGCEPSGMQTECLLEADDATDVAPIIVHGTVRALRVQRRVEAASDRGPATWDEGVEVEVPFSYTFPVARASSAAPRVLDVELPAETSEEDGAVRKLAALSLRITLSAGDVLPERGVARLRVEVENQTAFRNVSAPRDEVLEAALAGVHALLAAEGAQFVSSVDPPAWLREPARACVNKGAFPVLAGVRGGRDVMLASPIILYDHPAIAPESPGGLCDSTEIDEILTLRTLSLTDEEKREARLTDARAAAIVDRVDAMPGHTLESLHGARRDAPPALTKGSRVRLRPRRRADAQDMFLAGRIATVEQIKEDVDGHTHVAVTVDDDPAKDLHRWYGRYLYFAPDEVEPLQAQEPTP
jgi:hypothetical protein